MISASCVLELEKCGLQVDPLTHLLAQAFAEDAPDGDDKTSTAIIPPNQRSRAFVHSRKPGVVSGVCVARAVFEFANVENIKCDVDCGEFVKVGDKLLTIEGNTRDILRAERIALNFISHLSGISTLTRKWVDAVSGTGATIRDTRKTTPGLRQLEKFAVRMGGGMNHRMNLSDGAIIKDNHIAAAGSITQAVNRFRSEFPGIEIEVEVDNLQQLREALSANVDVVLLDNMDIAITREAVSIAKGSNTKLESSGGLTLENARAYAETGVNYLAIGALTHSAPILDIGLDF